MRLSGKVAIITGAAQGMGAAHAKLFVKEGAKVVLTDLLEEKGKKLAEELGSDNTLFVKQDVSNEDDWRNVVKQTKEKFGKVDILVNNAGITTSKTIEETTVADYQKVVNINQLSVFLGMREVFPVMKENGGGSIVNISSFNGIVGGQIGYTDTKFAVRGMSKAAALEGAAFGIRVNSVHPGAIETPMIHMEANRAAVEQFIKAIPLQRVAKPEEVSNMVLFLASDESSYSTGSEFIVDGGISAQ